VFRVLWKCALSFNPGRDLAKAGEAQFDIRGPATPIVSASEISSVPISTIASARFDDAPIGTSPSKGHPKAVAIVTERKSPACSARREMARHASRFSAIVVP
jgi:hypothetical protein